MLFPTVGSCDGDFVDKLRGQARSVQRALVFAAAITQSLFAMRVYSAFTEKAKRHCNCCRRDQCLLKGACLTTSLVYKATVTTANNRKEYFGLTEGILKQRFYSHQTSFRHEEHGNATELSKHIWDLKRASADFTITWSISRRAPAYSSKSKSCPLCLVEKVCIITADKRYLLNRRSELVSTCRHRRKHLMALFSPT